MKKKRIVGVGLTQEIYDALRQRTESMDVRPSMSQLAAAYIERGLREPANYLDETQHSSYGQRTERGATGE